MNTRRKARASLHEGAKTGNAEMVAASLQQGANPALPGADTLTPLHHAVLGCHLPIVRLLIAAGAPVDAPATCSPIKLHRRWHRLDPASGVTPLCLAVAKGYVDISEALIDAGASPNPVLSGDDDALDGASLLHLAVLGSEVYVLKTQMDKMINLLVTRANARADVLWEGYTPLAAAMKYLEFDDERYFNREQALVQALQTVPGAAAALELEAIEGTPLRLAIAERKESAVEVLLAAGADTEAAGWFIDSDEMEMNYPDFGDFSGIVAPHEGWKCLHVAAHLGLAKATRALLEAGAQHANEPCADEGLTPLMLAARRSGSDRGNLDPSPCDYKGVLEALVKVPGVEVDARRQSEHPPLRRTALHYALRLGSDEAVKVLLDAGAAPAASGALGFDPVFTAIEFEQGFDDGAAKVKLLAVAGAINPAARYTSTPGSGDRPPLVGATPLHYAVTRGPNLEAVLALLAAGCDATSRDDAGRTPLQAAMIDRPSSWPARGKALRDVRAQIVVELINAGDMDSWKCVPKAIPGIERALGPVNKAAPEKLGEVVRRMQKEVRERVQAALRGLHRLKGDEEGFEELRFRILVEAFPGTLKHAKGGSYYI